MSHFLSSAFEANNRALVAPVRAELVSICTDDLLHAQFLNMLSLLEHIGSRKIMTSPALHAGSQEMLKHLAEETRHAFFFKRAAERAAGRSLDYEKANTMGPAAARFYMARLDTAIRQAVGRQTPALSYLYMSLIVELRAVWLYRLYQAVLSQQHSTLSLKSVLAEEEQHLSAMLTRLNEADKKTDSRIAQFSQWEQTGFRRLWSEVEAECARVRLAAE